jgi:hypothetical protein
MIMAKPKTDRGSIAAILDKMPSSASEAEDVAPEMDGESVAAEEIMAAIEAKDPAAMKEALKSFIDMCMQDDSYESEPEAE